MGDAYLLISSDEARPPCPYIRQVNDVFAFYWRLLEKNYTDKQMLQAAENEFAAPSDQLESDLQQLLGMLESMGYIIKTQDCCSC